MEPDDHLDEAFRDTIVKLMKHPAYRDPKHPGHEKHVEYIRYLNREAYGSEPGDNEGMTYP